MNGFNIKYKPSIFGYVVLSLFMALFLPLFVYAHADNYQVIPGSYLLSYCLYYIYCIFSFWVWLYLFLLVKQNLKGAREISLSNGVLKFPASQIMSGRVEAPVSEIAKAQIKHARRTRIKYLQFYFCGKKYAFPEDSFSERDFSVLCNSLVKRSKRCKACQSLQVEWDGETGHCYNCETITPKNSDDFDWKDAYKA